MATRRIAVHLGLLGLSFSSSAGAAEAPGPVKGFILAGQSNMEG